MGPNRKRQHSTLLLLSLFILSPFLLESTAAAAVAERKATKNEGPRKFGFEFQDTDINGTSIEPARIKKLPPPYADGYKITSSFNPTHIIKPTDRTPLTP